MNQKNAFLGRRSLLDYTGLAGLMFILPGCRRALAQPPPTIFDRLPTTPRDRFDQRRSVLVSRPPSLVSRSLDGKTIKSLYGTLTVVEIDGRVFPVSVKTVDNLAEMKITPPEMDGARATSEFIRYGNGPGALVLTSAGLKIGSEPLRPWDRLTVSTLFGLIRRDPKKVRGAALLRSAILMNLPAAMSGDRGQDRSLLDAYEKMARSVSKVSQIQDCSLVNITETIYSSVETNIKNILTAEQQIAECIAAERGGLCGNLLHNDLINECAAKICEAKGLVDKIVGVVTTVAQVADEVTRTVLVCSPPPPNTSPNVFTGVNVNVGQVAAGVLPTIPAGLRPMEGIKFDQQTVDQALTLLRDIAGFLGPFGTCFFDAKWSLAQLDTKWIVSDSWFAVPYGIEACVSVDCAKRLAILSTWSEASTAWGASLGVLAALSTEFATLTGIAAVPAVAAAIAVLPAAVVAAAGLILAFVILALFYGTAVSVQFEAHKFFTKEWARDSDGAVCVMHPSFALLLIKILLWGAPPAELVPPIVMV